MELESVKRNLEKGGEIASIVDGLPWRFLEPLVMSGIRINLIEPGRVVCSMKIPHRLLNSGNSLHGGATATLVDLVGSAAIHTVGVHQEDIEIEARTLRIGKAVGVVSVEFRKKKTGKVFAQGRHTKYLPIASKI